MNDCAVADATGTHQNFLSLPDPSHFRATLIKLGENKLNVILLICPGHKLDTGISTDISHSSHNQFFVLAILS